MAEPPVRFADVLRGLRTEAGLTQEELAEAAGLTSRAISYLERGEVSTPHKHTVRLLADALGLAGPGRAQFETAARGRGGAGAGEAPAAARTLPRDVASFTGRQRELAELVEAAAGAGPVVSIHAIGGMAGIGKTAFAVHAAHRLAAQFPGGQIFLPLHGHTPGQQPPDPADALASLLAAIGVPAAQIPADLDGRMALWRDRAAERQLLVILDDAVSSEQVRPLLPGSGPSLVLITSRRHLSALEDVTPVSLDTLPPRQAAVLLARLTGRTGLNPDDPGVGELVRLCGFLPLAIGMVARQLRHHPAWTAAGRAADLAAATERLELLATENLSAAAAFDLSYDGLAEHQRRLLRRLGLHPGTDIDAYAAAALDGIDLAAARRGLEDLYDQYLLTEPAPGRYRLHDLIREYARAQAARLDREHDRDAAAIRLLDYYQQTAARANALIARQARPAPPAADGEVPTAVPNLADQEQALAWERAERANLLACLDQATRAGQHTRVIALTAGLSELLQRDGPWTDAITRHTAAIAAAQSGGDRLAHANALNDLGTVRRLAGDVLSAVQAHKQALGIYRQIGTRLGEANSLCSLGAAQIMTDDFPVAVQALEQALGTYRKLGDRLGQAQALYYLGTVRSMTDDYPTGVQALEQALGIHRELGDRLGQAQAYTFLGEVLAATDDYPAAAQAHEEALALYRQIGNRLGEANALNALGNVLRLTGDYSAAAQAHEEALALYRQMSSRIGQANALNSLGNALRHSGDYPAAARAQEQALDLYRQIGNRLGEANALNSLGNALRQTGDYPAAAQAHEEALGIYREINSRLGESLALNERGTLHRVSGELALAEGCHRQALEVARDIGGSRSEAQALAGLARCALTAGRTAEAEAGLRQALAILQRIGSAEAADISAELDALSASRL
ncbi:MAG TPA: helix-turn-helix transcriptional regulator [Streptosporangiaceae bacterium]|nr:helix-turn-helix transcriptional regulator [Streptosporangiaceae bacterium]